MVISAGVFVSRPKLNSNLFSLLCFLIILFKLPGFRERTAFEFPLSSLLAIVLVDVTAGRFDEIRFNSGLKSLLASSDVTFHFSSEPVVCILYPRVYGVFL